MEAVKNWRKPTNVHESRSFLSLDEYYRRSVEDLSKLFGPLTELSKKIAKFTRSEQCERSLQELK